MELIELLNDFAFALKMVDAQGPVEKTFQPGIGPHGEDKAKNFALQYLQSLPEKGAKYKTAKPQNYPRSREICDLVIPGLWAIEFKILRPFGNNNKEADSWSNKIIHPYYGNGSAVGDILKLVDSGFSEKKAVVLLAYEHEEAKIDLEPILKTLELIVKQIHHVNLGLRQSATQRGLIHQAHQVLHVIGWEILGK